MINALEKTQNEATHIFLISTLDIFEINGKLTRLPLSVYAHFTDTDIWTFTFNAAFPLTALKPLFVLVFVYITLA